MIERIFGAMKKRFKVLLLPPEYPFTTQAQIIPALALLHNFIMHHDPGEISHDDLDDEDGSEPGADDVEGALQATTSREERTRAAEHRDRIALAMWNEYSTRAPHRRV